MGRIIGIDLGTTNSLAATYTPEGPRIMIIYAILIPALISGVRICRHLNNPDRGTIDFRDEKGNVIETIDPNDREALERVLREFERRHPELKKKR